MVLNCPASRHASEAQRLAAASKKPITATILILDALWLWNDFLLPLIVVKAGTLQLAQLKFYGMFLREYGPAAASLILSATPIIAMYLALQKYIIKGIAAGAVKG